MLLQCSVWWKLCSDDELCEIISYATIRKHIAIGENLDYEPRQFLDGKGKNKLTIGLALKYCEVPNKEHQYDIYQRIVSSRSLTNRQKISSFEDHLDCNICCFYYFQEKLPVLWNIYVCKVSL